MVDVNHPTEEGDALELDAAHNDLSESLGEANGTGEENNVLDLEATADISGQLIEPNGLICDERNNSREPSTTNDDSSSPTNKTEVKKKPKLSMTISKLLTSLDKCSYHRLNRLQ